MNASDISALARHLYETQGANGLNVFDVAQREVVGRVGQQRKMVHDQRGLAPRRVMAGWRRSLLGQA